MDLTEAEDKRGGKNTQKSIQKKKKTDLKICLRDYI